MKGVFKLTFSSTRFINTHAWRKYSTITDAKEHNLLVSTTSHTHILSCFLGLVIVKGKTNCINMEKKV